jgi:hypothetical protein
VLSELERIQAEAQETDAREDAEGRAGSTQLGKPVKRDQMRDILRRVRKRLARTQRGSPSSCSDAGEAAEPTADPFVRGSAPVSGRNAISNGRKMAGIAHETDRAVAAHAEWKDSLADAIASGASELSVSQVAAANRCEFGR